MELKLFTLKFTTDYVRPVCLPNRYYLSETFVDEEVRVSGWGKPKDKSPAISTDLKNTTLSVMTNSKCRKQFRGLVSGNLICTATKWNASPCRVLDYFCRFFSKSTCCDKNYLTDLG